MHKQREKPNKTEKDSQARNWKTPEMVNLFPLLRVKSCATNTKMPRMENIQASTELACTAWTYSAGGARERRYNDTPRSQE